MKILNSRVIRISIASILTGSLIGLVGGAFRYCLIAVDNGRNALTTGAHAWPHLGWTAPVALALAGAGLARFLVVRFAPIAEGSGVQRVEADIADEVELVPYAVVPVKFFGGVIAIGSGLALGREGPTVQMGATLSRSISRLLTEDDQDGKIIEAAGAGAGLAVAFNAPVGGSVFVFEELTSSFTPWLLVATLAACSVAVWIMRGMLGNTLDFTVQHVSATHDWKVAPFLALGALLGAVGALYNAVTVGLLRLSDRLYGISSVYRAAFIGATIGLVAWFAPSLVGGGEVLSQAILADQYAIGGLVTVFLARFLIGPWSFAGRYFCPAPGARRLVRRTFRRSPESFHSIVEPFTCRLCCGRDGRAILGQRTCASDRNCARGRNDGPRGSDACFAWSFIDGHGGCDPAQ